MRQYSDAPYDKLIYNPTNTRKVNDEYQSMTIDSVREYKGDLVKR